jgi:hypothetical protein
MLLYRVEQHRDHGTSCNILCGPRPITDVIAYLINSDRLNIMAEVTIKPWTRPNGTPIGVEDVQDPTVRARLNFNGDD